MHSHAHSAVTWGLCYVKCQDAQWEFMRASNKIRFIRAVINGDLLLSNRKRLDIEADLDAQGFDKMAKSKDVSGFTWPCAQKLASASITVICSAQANYLVKSVGDREVCRCRHSIALPLYRQGELFA